MDSDQADVEALVHSLASEALGGDERGVPLTDSHRVVLEETPGESVEHWWLRTAQRDFEATVPKMVEYGGAGSGSSDLRTMGYALAELCDLHDAPDAVKLELAVWFYILGKVSRLVSDYKAGKAGKPDTWFDISVYAMMGRRIQETGDWPGNGGLAVKKNQDQTPTRSLTEVLADLHDYLREAFPAR